MFVKLQNFTPIPFCGCHIWLGSVDKDGYGTIRRPDGAHLKAHRESYREYKGDPEGFDVCHTCDITCCINPDHLYLGNPATNGADKKIRGRARTLRRFGEANPASKLTDLQRMQIKIKIQAGEKQRNIAIAFGVSQAYVSKLARQPQSEVTNP